MLLVIEILTARRVLLLSGGGGGGGVKRILGCTSKMCNEAVKSDRGLESLR